jgi:F-actin capping protein, beta subunit
MDAAILLLNQAPPSNLEQNVPWLLRAAAIQQQQPPQTQQLPVTTDERMNDVRNKYYIPFQVVVVDESNTLDGERPFLICAYNNERSNQLYRSPWTNRLYDNSSTDRDHNERSGNSSTIDAIVEVKNEELRRLEVTFNEVWDAYKNLYYGHDSVGSVYLKESDLDNGSFEGLFGIQKKTNVGSSWNSASIVHVYLINENECQYSVETSLCVVLAPPMDTNDNDDDNNHVVGTVTTTADVSALMTKTCTKTCTLQPDRVPVHVSHIEHIGTMIEANEIDVRSNLERVWIPKNQEIMSTLQKKQIQRPQVNPLMGMVMNSDVLKKRLAKTAAGK